MIATLCFIEENLKILIFGLESILKIIPILNTKICIITDREKGIMNAIQKVSILFIS